MRQASCPAAGMYPSVSCKVRTAQPQWTCACGGSGLLAVRRRSQSLSAPAAGVMSRAAISWSGGTGGAAASARRA